MVHVRLYILQFLCVLAIWSGFLINNQPDSKSVMHFDHNASANTVFQKAHKHKTNTVTVITSLQEHNKHTHKIKQPKAVSFDMVLLPNYTFVFKSYPQIVYSVRLPLGYHYLYCQEINPPPPKSC